MFHVKQNFVLAPQIYHCCGIVMYPCPTSLFVLLLMLLFLFLWHFSREFFRSILLTLTVKFLPTNFFWYHLPPPLILFLLYLDVSRAWLYLKIKKPKLKQSSSSQLLLKDFPKFFSECAMFIRDRRNTNLQFVILLIIKKLPPITIHLHNFLVFFL